LKSDSTIIDPSDPGTIKACIIMSKWAISGSVDGAVYFAQLGKYAYILKPPVSPGIGVGIGVGVGVGVGIGVGVGVGIGVGVGVGVGVVLFA
jgi:hypothetical protein